MEPEETPRKKYKRSPKRVAEVLERGTRILELRRDGYSLRQISSILRKEAKDAGRSTRGYSHEQVRTDFQAIIAFTLEEQQETVDEMRVLAAERLESVLQSYMPYVLMEIKPLTSDNEVRMKIKAGDVVLKAMREYNELFGIKTPQKMEITGADGKDLIPQKFIVEVVTNDSDSSTTEEN